MNLLELQRRMATDVTRPLTPEFSMQTVSEDGEAVEEIAASYIRPNDRLSSFDRLEIYNRQYWLRVMGAVAEDFPVLQAVVGARKFDALALAYLLENPSTSFTLRNLGAKLPQWLESHPELSLRRHRLALDVARLEWAYVEAYDGAALPPMTDADLTGLTERSLLSLQPHVQLLALGYPVDELVLAVHHANPAADIASNAVSERRRMQGVSLPRMRKAATYLAVHRFEETVYYRRLDREAYLLLSTLRQRRTLGDALEVAFLKSRLPVLEQARKTQRCFAHAAELGWFCQNPRVARV